MLYLVQKENPAAPISLADIAAAIDAPPAFLAKTMQRLNHKGLVSAVKGSQGGYFLAAEQLNVRLGHIVNAIDGDHSLKSCLLSTSQCDPNNPCILHSRYKELRKQFDAFFDQQRLVDFRNTVGRSSAELF